jgi:hypothetical protein
VPPPPAHHLHTTRTQPGIKARDQLRGQLIPAEKPLRLRTPERSQPRIRTLPHVGAGLNPPHTIPVVHMLVPADLVDVGPTNNDSLKMN